MVHLIGSWASKLPLSLYIYMSEFGEVLLLASWLLHVALPATPADNL